MNATRRAQLIRQSAVANSSIARMQTFIESGHCKVNEIQMMFDDLQGICGRYDTAQNELDLTNDTDHFVDRELFDNQCYEVKAKFSELLHPVNETKRFRNSPLRSRGEKTGITFRGHIRLAHTVSYQP